MNTDKNCYEKVVATAREILRSSDPTGNIVVGETAILLSRVRVLESGEPMPAPYPKVDLPDAEDYGTWLK